METEGQYLTTSTDMIIKAIDPNKTGNQGLINRRKIQICRFLGALHFILKNHITRTSYTLFQPQMDICMYTEDVTSCTIVCGMILLKISMTTMNPQLVINHREKDMDLENLSLALRSRACGHCFHTTRGIDFRYPYLSRKD